MAQGKVVIRINVDKQQSSNQPVIASTITVWHRERIILAVSILILVLLLLFWGVNSALNWNDNNNAEKTDWSVSVQPKSELSKYEVVQPKLATRESVVLAEQNPPKKSTQLNEKIFSGKAIILDKKVLRASLNTLLKENEPFQQASLPIRLLKNHPVELFYFNEIKAGKNPVLFHHWLRDGRRVYSKKFEAVDSSAKVVSSRKLSYDEKGLWRVQLVDAGGKVYSEVEFLAVAE
jgi:hypothetical protein